MSAPSPPGATHPWLFGAEVVLMLPATALMGLSVFPSFGLVLAIVFTLADTSTPLPDRLANAALPAHFLLWLGGGWVGIGAAWVAVLEVSGRERRAASPLGRTLRIAGLLAGFFAAGAWSIELLRQWNAGGDARDVLIWLAILAGPYLVGTRHLLRLLLSAATHRPT